MKRFGVVIIIGLMACLVLSMIPSVNGLDGEVYTLEYNTYAEYNRTLTENDGLYFEFETGNNIPIDVYLVTDLNYELYLQDNDFYSIDNGTFLNASEGIAYLDISDTDHYYIIIDNTHTGPALPPSTNNGEVVIEIVVIFYIADLSPLPPANNEVSVVNRSDPYYYWPGYILSFIFVLMVILVIYLVRSGDDYLNYS